MTVTDTTTACPAIADDGIRQARKQEETTLDEQVRGILAEALDSPALTEDAKATLRALMAEHRDRPALAFLEHLALIRSCRPAQAAVPDPSF